MRLGTKILLLTLAATVGLSGTVIWLVTRDVTAREIDRARHTIKWAVSGYFQCVEERHQRDARLAHLLLEDETRELPPTRGNLEIGFDQFDKIIASVKLP